MGDRARRISDSGINTSSRYSALSSSGLAERLSGFAQTVRGLSRSSTSDHSSFASHSQPSTPSLKTKRSFLSKSTDDSDDNSSYSRPPVPPPKTYKSWDEFLCDYRQGLFTATATPLKPQLNVPYPDMPEYVDNSKKKDTPSFLAAPLPANEEKRLRALYSLQILKTSRDPNFERIVQLVSAVMGTKECMINLIDHDVLWTKAQLCGSSNVAARREETICSHTILLPSDQPLVVLDTLQDWRFQKLPAVRQNGVRFYAGAPLRTSDGLNVGALCLTDSQPRASFSERERRMLVDFAAVVMREMELWNDQVQLCIRDRMMRDVTRWVRGCLDLSANDEASSDDGMEPDELKSSHDHKPCDHVCTENHSLVTPLNSSFPTPIAGVMNELSLDPAQSSQHRSQVFPTPSGSPAPRCCGGRHSSTTNTVRSQTRGTSQTNNPLLDKAFPSACLSIQATLDVDAVYLVQASSTNHPVMPSAGPSIVWNYLESGRQKGSVGVVSGGQPAEDAPDMHLIYLASSRKDSPVYRQPILDDLAQRAKRDGNGWVCDEEGCRPHRLGDHILQAIEPSWERDMPLMKEMLSYVRQEAPCPRQHDGRLFSCTQGSDSMDGEWIFGACDPSIAPRGDQCQKLLCHTFEGTLPRLVNGAKTPYKSSIVVPILGPPSAASSTGSDIQPWAYFIIMSSSKTKQFSVHERIYLKNFGSCLITEVLKRRVEAADKSKGVFIKSISHELRTPLHIIMGILELLHANTEEPLSEHQQAMVASAEVSGRSLIDIINNIIDLAKLDPDNTADFRTIGPASARSRSSSYLTRDTSLEEVDIRDLCEQVASSKAKAVVDKNIIVSPSWTKPSIPSLAQAATSPSAATSAPITCNTHRNPPTPDNSRSGYTSSAESANGFTHQRHSWEKKPSLELLVALSEQDGEADDDVDWCFMLDVPVVKRILNQLVENAIKFTKSGFVELTASAPSLKSVPLKPPNDQARPILFTICDTGKGISREFVQTHLFQRFSQEDPLQVGTGLGLALVKLLVENLGGWLEIWSEGIEGKGCLVKVLVWATPVHRPSRSLKASVGAWQEKSCRFFTGEPSVGTDRLWEKVGLQMMVDHFHMNVERGNEQDESADEMMKALQDHSPCDLLMINDDLDRLRAYLLAWTERHRLNDDHATWTSVPLLMLASISNLKTVRAMVDNYMESHADSGCTLPPQTVVIMTKPVGPLKLHQCLRDCFTPVSNPDVNTPQGSPVLGPKSDNCAAQRPPPLNLLRSATVPHITTSVVGVHDGRLPSAGGFFKSIKLDAEVPQVPPHSPGGLVLPRNENLIRAMGLVSQPSTPGEELLKPMGAGEMEVQKTDDGASSSSSPTNATARPKSQPILKHSQPNGSMSSSNTGSSSAVTNPTSAPTRVLVVEDNITNRMILRTFLKKNGISVVEAENGLLGVEKFQEEVMRCEGRKGFDFVLMDLQMPVMDGNVATKRIREYEQTMMMEGVRQAQQQSPTNTPAHEATPEIATAQTAEQMTDATFCEPLQAGAYRRKQAVGGYRPTFIFALTGLASDEDKRLAFECGVDGYLTKPVSLKTLGSILTKCLA
ncbi:His Kinase A domain containing protein [Actinomortierella wolfii]|nr:His Kinase A domain containing protein [Actinomortierella wolfii]